MYTLALDTGNSEAGGNRKRGHNSKGSDDVGQFQ